MDRTKRTTGPEAALVLRVGQLALFVKFLRQASPFYGAERVNTFWGRGYVDGPHKTNYRVRMRLAACWTAAIYIVNCQNF
jgi:hypothetical protein